eukprot:1733336-Amphidinium_carterae.4
MGDNGRQQASVIAGINEFLKIYPQVEFIEASLLLTLQLKHPFDTTIFISDCVIKNVAWIVNEGPDAVAHHRASVLSRIRSRSQQLSDAKMKLHTSMSHFVRSVVHNKKLLLYKELLEEVGHPTIA